MRAVAVEITPGFCAAVPLRGPGQVDLDISIHVVEDEIALPGEQRGMAQRREIRGRPDQMRDICLRLHHKDVAAATAVICHGWGQEMRLQCVTCRGRPFGKCVTLRNPFNNACSTCILKGRERLCG